MPSFEPNIPNYAAYVWLSGETLHVGLPGPSREANTIQLTLNPLPLKALLAADGLPPNARRTLASLLHLYDVLTARATTKPSDQTIGTAADPNWW